jgi:hypothetical protein
MTFPGAETMKAGAMGEEAFRGVFDRGESLSEWPLMPLILLVPFMVISTR